jgi:hypothetical protein
VSHALRILHDIRRADAAFERESFDIQDHLRREICEKLTAIARCPRRPSAAIARRTITIFGPTSPCGEQAIVVRLHAQQMVHEIKVTNAALEKANAALKNEVAKLKAPVGRKECRAAAQGLTLHGRLRTAKPSL